MLRQHALVQQRPPTVTTVAQRALRGQRLLIIASEQQAQQCMEYWHFSYVGVSLCILYYASYCQAGDAAATQICFRIGSERITRRFHLEAPVTQLYDCIRARACAPSDR
jgi:hypothetical protein